MLDSASPPEGSQKPFGLASSSISVGGVINGKYRVERVIGEGGMGVVVAATHLSLDRKVAIKLLGPKARGNQEALERFTREARAAAKIQSEHVGRVVDVDALPNGGPFIVMELLEGHDLSVELRANPRIPADRAVTHILQACEAIAEAHAAGIVHRDLKPANLFLAKMGGGDHIIKVLDFGISKITRREDSGATTDDKALTNAGSMLGSPLYMSPEQMQASAEVDKRTDIWSLGVILYELVSGRSPFDAKTIPVICAQVLSVAAPPLDVPDVPAGFEKALLRCLEKDPDKRYRDVAHMARALGRFAPAQAAITLDRISKLRDESGEVAATPATLPPPHSKEGSLTITSWNAKPETAPRRRWLPLAFAGVGSLVVLAFAIQNTLADKPVAIEPAPADAQGTTAEATASAVETADVTAASAGASDSGDASADVTSSVAASEGVASADVASSAAGTGSASAKPAFGARLRYTATAKPSGPTTSKTAGFGGRE